MNALGALRTYLEQHFPRTTDEELRCTCGAGNHVRIRHFRVSGQPAAVVIPEGATLTASDFGQVLSMDRVEPLLESELDEVCSDTELGHTQPFDNPFGASVFADESLLPFSDLVFCPRMFFGQRGQCFRVPTQEFLDLTQAIVLPITAAPAQASNDWAV